MTGPEFKIPAVRGIQGGHAFFTAMCPIRLLPRLFPIGVDKSTNDASQSFRKVSLTRVREIAKNIIAHREDFHLATVTISIEQHVRFLASGSSRSKEPTAGDLVIPLEARLTVVDGIHRIYGLQRALSECPSLANDCISLLIHIDPDGTRRGQIFSDVKRHERPSAQSLRIGLDDRDEMARLTREVITIVPAFVDSIEMEKTAISNRSRKLFTLSALYQANQVLLADSKDAPYADKLRLATDFWNEVSARIPGWAEIIDGQVSAAEIRANYIHCHGIGIAAIARAGRSLLAEFPNGWQKRLKKLSSLNWSRANSELWEGRAMIGGRLSKSSSAVALAGNAVKMHLGLKLTADEQAMEE